MPDPLVNATLRAFSDDLASDRPVPGGGSAAAYAGALGAALAAMVLRISAKKSEEPLGPRIAEQLGSKIKAVVFTQGGSLLFLLVMGFVPAYWISGVAYLIRGALMNMSSPLYSAFAMEQTPERGSSSESDAAPTS